MSKSPSLEPPKTTTEQVKDQLSDPQREIFDFLRANPQTAFTYGEIGELLDKHPKNVRKHIVERGMVDEAFEVNGGVVDGLLTHQKDGRSKCWYLRPEIEEILDKPPIEERVVEKEREVARHQSVGDVLRYHSEFAWSLLFLALVGGLMWLVEVFYAQMYGGFGKVLFGVGFVGLATMVAIAYRETS